MAGLPSTLLATMDTKMWYSTWWREPTVTSVSVMTQLVIAYYSHMTGLHNALHANKIHIFRP